jgi:class 3 adenylate cyclase
MPFRIGIHLGDITGEGEHIYGDGVNIAARLQALAQPGGISISAEIQRLVRHKLELACEDLGEQTLKNLPDPVHVYRLRIYAAGEPGGSEAAGVGRARGERPA